MWLISLKWRLKIVLVVTLLCSCPRQSVYHYTHTIPYAETCLVFSHFCLIYHLIKVARIKTNYYFFYIKQEEGWKFEPLCHWTWHKTLKSHLFQSRLCFSSSNLKQDQNYRFTDANLTLSMHWLWRCWNTQSTLCGLIKKWQARTLLSHLNIVLFN